MKTKPLKILAIRLVVLMGLYSLMRGVFFIYHRHLFGTFKTNDVVIAFVHGWRFDMAAIAWINAIFVILALWPLLSEGMVRSLFIILNGAFLIASFNDLELFAFNGKRLSREFFSSLGIEILEQLPQAFIHYWYLPVAGIAGGVALWKLDSWITKRLKDRRLSRPLSLCCAVFFPAVTFIAIRGGLQHKSIQVQSAFGQGANELGHLTLNTPYHFLRTFNTPGLTKKNWFSEEELRQGMRSLTVMPALAGISRQNVVLIILESFSLESYEQGYAPFLKRFAGKSLYFDHNFANGRRSIEVLSSLIDGVPSVQDVPFSKSNAQGMKLEGLASRLRSEGWATEFFHGAARGSMGFEAYTLAHGFQRYHARDDYTGPASDFDGHWGIYDGPWLGYCLHRLNELSEPFFAGIFTLSSHQPYSIPPALQGRFPKGTLAIHESMGYTDYALEQFFAKAQQMPWYQNTLFVLTADHTQKLATKKFTNSVGIYRVPLVIHHPRAAWSHGVSHKVVQHIDVPTTILDVLDVPATGLNLVGESAFSVGPGKALQYLQPGWQYIRGERIFMFEEGREGREFIWEPETGKRRETTPSGIGREAKLLIQYLLNGLRDGQWSIVRSE